MKAEVAFTIEPPVECTEEQFREWIEYNIRSRADMKLDNPLCFYDLELSNSLYNKVQISIR